MLEVFEVCLRCVRGVFEVCSMWAGVFFPAAVAETSREREGGGNLGGGGSDLRSLQKINPAADQATAPF